MQVIVPVVLEKLPKGQSVAFTDPEGQKDPKGQSKGEPLGQ